MPDQKETTHLSRIREIILTQINKVASGLKSRRDNVVEARKSMSRATGVVRDFDDVVLLTMYATEVAQQESAYSETSTRLKRLQRLLNSPYFARIDFTEDGYDPEEIYIGRYSLVDETTHNYYVYDWRAPISSLYYDYGVGPASFKIPPDSRGELPPVAGEITLKRQFQIQKGELVYFFDSDLAVEDDILRLELSKISDAKIKTIIHSIQKEQNAAIRSESRDVLVMGPAGSGKTSVGLHRLAYLLYRHRDTLSSAKVRIFSPSPIFASYIEGIIPDLGEDDVDTLDFPTLLATYLPSKRAFHDQYQQIEYLSTAPEGDPRRRWLIAKYSPEFIAQLENYIATYSPSFDPVTFNQDVLCDRERLQALYADRTSAGNLTSKTARIMTYVHQRYDEYFDKNKRTIAELFNAIHDDNFSTGEIRRLYEEEKSIVIADLKSRLKPRARRIYERVLASYGKKNGLPIGFAKESLHQEKLYFEDALMLMYIDLLTGRIAPQKQVKHILVDEAQDMSHLQHRILRRLFTDSHFTVLADANQALYPAINLHCQAELQALHPKAQFIPLTTSYRSTYEISKFAATVLGSENTAGLYARHGDEPAIIETNNPAKAVWEVIGGLPKEYNTIGVLLSTAREAKKFYEEMTAQSDLPVKLVAESDANFSQGLMVMALPYAKGLEFDAVICPEYGKPLFDGHFGRKMLYLICTRALHNLYLIKGGQHETAITM